MKRISIYRGSDFVCSLYAHGTQSIEISDYGVVLGERRINGREELYIGDGAQLCFGAYSDLRFEVDTNG